MNAYINRFRHLGHSAASRVEGGHSAIKSWLVTSTHDLKGAIDKLSLATRKQRTEIDHRAVFDATHSLVLSSSPIWSRVNRCVSHYALKRAHEQLAKAKKLSAAEPCTGVFTKIFGIPCAHTLRSYLASSLPIELKEFDSQWYVSALIAAPTFQQIESSSSVGNLVSSAFLGMTPHQQHEYTLGLHAITQSVLSTQVLNPEVVRGKGRPVGAKNQRKTGTERDPSEFEIVCESGGRSRKCTKCSQAGHNSRTCKNK